MFQIKIECPKGDPRPDTFLKYICDHIIETHTDENITDLVRSWNPESPIICELGSWLWEFEAPYNEYIAIDLQTIIQNKLIGLYESDAIYNDSYIKIIYEADNEEEDSSSSEEEEEEDSSAAEEDATESVAAAEAAEEAATDSSAAEEAATESVAEAAEEEEAATESVAVAAEEEVAPLWYIAWQKYFK
jgi:hypothetical protein